MTEKWQGCITWRKFGENISNPEVEGLVVAQNFGVQNLAFVQYKVTMGFPTFKEALNAIAEIRNNYAIQDAQILSMKIWLIQRRRLPKLMTYARPIGGYEGGRNEPCVA